LTKTLKLWLQLPADTDGNLLTASRTNSPQMPKMSGVNQQLYKPNKLSGQS